MATRNEFVQYVVDTYYDGDADEAARVSGYSKAQITGWVRGDNTPQEGSVGWLLHRAIAPEFQVIAEYVPIETSGTKTSIRTQLRKMLGGHEKGSGLYAFYDSMANLVYIGKSDGNLFEECSTQLSAALHTGVFPKGAKQPKARVDVVRYISAYYVQGSDFEDYAKHVESLILRISKPALNKNIGKLQKAAPR